MHLFFFYRFRVESMEISDNDVRIKDSSNSSVSAGASPEKGKTKLEKHSSPKESDNEALSESEDFDNPFSTSPSMTNITFCSKRRNLTRSRSISTPKAREPKLDEFDLCCSKPSQSTSQNSLSTLQDNLEMWKKSLDEASRPMTKEEPREKPVLVLSKSLTEKHGYLATNPIAHEKKWFCTWFSLDLRSFYVESTNWKIESWKIFSFVSLLIEGKGEIFCNDLNFVRQVLFCYFIRFF